MFCCILLDTTQGHLPAGVLPHWLISSWKKYLRFPRVLSILVCPSVFGFGSVQPSAHLPSSHSGGEQKYLRCSLCPCTGCITLAGHDSPCFGHYKLCGVFKARRDGLQAGQSVEVDIHQRLICRLAFWFVTEGGYTPESRLHGCGSNSTAMCSQGLSWWIDYTASLLRLSLYDGGFAHISNSI